MRIFVYEHITGGALAGEALPESLLRDGDAMLHSLLDDLVLAGATPRTTRDQRLGDLAPGVAVDRVGSAARARDAWRRALAWCDAVWPIAPECGGLLQRLSEEIVASGRILLGSRPEAVAIATSKRRTCERLRASGIAATPVWDAGKMPADALPPWVVKPDDGAGCEQTWLVESREALAGFQHGGEACAGAVVVPFVDGVPASVSLVCAGDSVRLLSCNRQRVQRRGQALCFEGTDVGALAEHEVEWRGLAAAVVRAIPGLWGYVGIDLVQGDGGPVVLEVNPRLTVSYCGIRPVTGLNPAALVLANV